MSSRTPASRPSRPMLWRVQGGSIILSLPDRTIRLSRSPQSAFARLPTTKKPDAPTERCFISRLDNVFATNAFAILLNTLRRMHPAWDHFSCLCEASLPHIQHFSALFRFWPWHGMTFFGGVSTIFSMVSRKNSWISKKKSPDMPCQELSKCYLPKQSAIIYSWQTLVLES